jgi:hypothetical protein
MTLGTDSAGLLQRFKSLIPYGWFDDAAPLRDVVFGGLSDGLAWNYNQIMAVKAQTRRATSRGWMLDLYGWDFLGSRVLRRDGEGDPAWSARIQKEIFRPRVTRQSISDALTDLTGRTPVILEPWNANDCGAYDLGGIAYAGSDFVASAAAGYDLGGALDTGLTGYDLQIGATGNTSAGMGAWGSLEVPYQMFVTAFRPLGAGIQNASGTDVGSDGYDIGVFRYTDETEVTSPVSDDEIYAAVAATEPAGVIAWTAISD